MSAMLFLLTVFLASSALAEPMFHAFWPKNPNNNHREEVPDGEPATIDEFWKMLTSKSTDYSRSQSHIIGDQSQGSTWWFMAKIEKELVDEKYEKLKFVSIERAAADKAPLL